MAPNRILISWNTLKRSFYAPFGNFVALAGTQVSNLFPNIQIMIIEFIVNNFLLVYLLELGAAIAGTYYLKKIEKPKLETRIFVYYLWLVVFVELVGVYSVIAYLSNYEIFPFIKDTLFERNFWWYNSYNVIKFIVFYYFFIEQLESVKKRRIFYSIAILLIIGSLLYLILSGEFFTRYSTIDVMGGTIFLTVLIFFYYFDLLKSNKILHFHKSIAFYISVGLLVWHLTVSPIFIYNSYFSTQSPEFIKLHAWVLKIINVFLYGIIIAGFIICSGKKFEFSAPSFLIAGRKK